MIKKLRIRFVIVAMTSVIIVLGIIMFITNIVSYSKVTDSADSILTLLAQNDGKFSSPPFVQKPNGPMGIETPYETRFFSIKYYKNGMVTADTHQIAAVDELSAIEMGNKVLMSGKANDFEEEYRYLISEKEMYTLVIFMDCTRQLETANNFLKSSMLVSIGALVGVFILLVIFSKPLVLPIAKSYERQKRFITDASHELKTPLTIISANNELIEMENGESESTRAIEKQVNRLTTLVKNLISLSKIDESERLNSAKNFSLSDALIDVCENFKVAFRNSNKYFTYDVEEGIDYFGDENLIRQLINILLDNANKYSLTKVNVNLEKVGNKINIVVTNDSKEVEERNLKEYFERFYRSQMSRSSDVEGSGIGLSLAKEIVTLHKGEISAYGIDTNTFQIKIEL